MNNDLEEQASTNDKAAFSQVGDSNIQLGHADRLIINNNYGVNESRRYFTDTIDKNVDAFFVKTTFYEQTLEALKNNNIVILIGQPGVGKTITSEKIAYDFKMDGFKVLRSEEGNIGNAKNLLSEQLPKEKTLIILNDFLGQFYTSFKKSASSELKELFSFLRQYDHIKLLINTRGIIYREALQNNRFNSEISSPLNSICEIHMNDLTFIEKSLILHRHLKRAFDKGLLSSEHYLAVVNNGFYAEIINHKNFSPLIIYQITTKSFVAKTRPQDYKDKISASLENPSKIWEEEYIELEKFDRILLNTLFSLTNTNVPIEVLRECFEARIMEENHDSTIDYFERSINRLAESLVKINDFSNKQIVGVLYPSINDFLWNHLLKHNIEIQEIIKYSMYYEQIDRLISDKSIKFLIEQINNGLFKRLYTFPKQIFTDFEFSFAPPNYLYMLKILLIHLKENDLIACNLQKEDIQNLVYEIFEKHYVSIEANSRLYFANEFPVIFVELFKNNNDYDMNGIITNDQYFKVIMESIARCDGFWEILDSIQKRYYSSSKESFYKAQIVEASIIERVRSEVVWEIMDDIKSMIETEIEENCDELEEYGDYNEIVDFVLQDIEDDIHSRIVDHIESKLEEYKINSINNDSFDINEILSQDIDINEMIEHKYSEVMYVRSDNYTKQVKEPIEDIFKLFEDTSWLS